MRILGRLLSGVLQKYEKIIVYGTGWFAMQLYPIMCKNGLSEKIMCFAVSTIDDQRQFEGFEIKEIDRIVCCKENTAILVAVTKQYQDEVAMRACKAGFTHIILPEEYVWSDENMMKLYQNLDYDEFIGCVYDNYISDCLNEKDLSGMTKEHLLAHNGKKDFDSMQIVYISGCLTPRSTKIINALRKKGYTVTLILFGFIQEIILNEVQSQKISCIQCSCEEEVLFHALKYRPLVYFYEPPWKNCNWLQIVLQYKDNFRPIVVGLYDVMNDGYAIEDQRLLESEKYVLENADGVVWRWFSKDYLKEEKGFLYKGKSIQFHDYCGGYLKDNKSIRQHAGNVLKLCTVQGSFWIFSQEGDVPDGYETFASLKDITNLLGNRKDCVLDIYIGICDEKGMEEAEKIEAIYSNIRFFWNTNHMELIDRLQDYDYGCEFYNSGKIIPLDMKIRYGVHEHYGSLNTNSVSNRFYDYIDAGLPVISIMPHKQIDFLSKYGIIVHMCIQDFDMDFLIKNAEELKRKAVAARQELDIDNHIDELIQFFKELS